MDAIEKKIKPSISISDKKFDELFADITNTHMINEPLRDIENGESLLDAMMSDEANFELHEVISKKGIARLKGIGGK